MINTPASVQKGESQPQPKKLYYGKLNNKFNLIEKIGKGATSSVFSAQLCGDDPSYLSSKNKLFAVKICKRNWSTKTFIEEGRIMKNFNRNDTNIITFYESGKGMLIKSNKKPQKFVFYHVFELAENFELFDYLKVRGFGEKFGRILFKQILSAVETCHQRGIVHKDIKTENILLTLDYQCKLAEFGLSVEVTSKRPQWTITGTDGYFPPEIHSNKNYDLIQCDLFALGICLFIIVCGFKPFYAAKRLDPLYRRIWKGNYELYWKDLPNKIELSTSFKEMINRMFALNPSDRLTIEDIKQCKWMNECIITEDDKFLLNKEFESRKSLVEEYRKTKHFKEKK